MSRLRVAKFRKEVVAQFEWLARKIRFTSQFVFAFGMRETYITFRALSDRQSAEAYRPQIILIDPFDEKEVEAASYDLRGRPQGISSTSKKIVDIR